VSARGYLLEIRSHDFLSPTTTSFTVHAHIPSPAKARIAPHSLLDNMRHTITLFIILGAVSTLAAPITIKPQDSTNLSSYTANAVIDEAHPPSNADIVLVPVTEVFAIMASHQSPSSSSTITLSASTGVPGLAVSPKMEHTEILPSASSHPVSTPTWSPTIHLGPGLVVSPTNERIEILPTTSPSERTDPPHEAPTVAHKLIFASVVILSMVTLILAIYAFSYHRHQLRMSKLKMLESSVFPEAKEKEKERGRFSVVNITRNFPRSKFSVTSSDYPRSARTSHVCESVTSSEGDSEDAESEHESYGGRERGLMDPAHFFALRASSMAINAYRRHSRGESAPVFGVPRYDARREQSRRSRSVSGPREEWL
jgi:hypothetical protein